MRLQTRFRPGTVVLVLCALLFAAMPLAGYYFYDDFADGDPLAVSGYDSWVIDSFSGGNGGVNPSAAVAPNLTVTESSGGLHITGPSDQNALTSKGIRRGPFAPTADKPFGVTIQISALAFAPAGTGGPFARYELTLAKSLTEYASIVVYKAQTGNYFVGYVWRDGLVTAPVTGLYETEVYVDHGAAWSGTHTLQLTHDGSQARFFYDGTELPYDADTTYAPTKAFVNWTNFNVYIMGTLKGATTQITSGTVDWCLMRSAVSTTSNSVSEIFPRYVSTSSSLTFTNYILPAFDSADDAGVDVVTVTLPTGYSGLAIGGVYSDYNSDGALDALSLTGGVPAGNQYSVSISGNKATIRLGTSIGYATANKQIRVVFTATTPATANFYGSDVTTTVERKYAGGTANSTSGPTVLISGNAEPTVTSESIAVSVYDQPQVEVAIDPYAIGYDAVNTVFNYNVRNASAVGNQGVTKLRLSIPTNFTLQGVSSLILSAAEQATAVSVDGQVVTVNYGLVGRNIPAGGGTDVISFTLSDNFTDTSNPGPHLFTSQVDDAVAPSGWINTTVQSGNTNGVMITAVQARASAYIKPNSIYTSVSNSTFSFYLVNNASGSNPITWARVTLPAGFFVDNVADVTSSVIGGSTGISISGSNVITVSYSNASTSIPTFGMDILTLKVRDTITEPAYGRKWSAIVDNGFGFNPAAQDAGLSVDVIDSPFGGVTGKVYPLDVISSVTLYTNGTEIVGGTATTDGVTGFYQIAGLNPGTYDVYAIGAGYAGARYLTSITVVANQNSALADIYMNQNALDSESGAVQSRKFIDDPLTKIDFPIGSLNADTFVTVTEITTLTAAQLADMQNNTAISNPASTASFDVVTVEMQSSSGQTLANLGLKKDALLQIHYDSVEIAAKGWTEDSLAIYYWDGLHWIKIGGTKIVGDDLIQARVRNIAGI